MPRLVAGTSDIAVVKISFHNRQRGPDQGYMTEFLRECNSGLNPGLINFGIAR